MTVDLSLCDITVILSALNDSIRTIKNDPSFIRDLKEAYNKLSAARPEEKPVLTGGVGDDLEF
jgi:hypothetical protein